MRHIRKIGFWIPLCVAAYLLLPIVIFNFSEVAVPFDEETHAGREVAIGPRPRDRVPWAANGFDIPGGYDYAPDGWPFVVWKPVCLIYLKLKGYEAPAEWR